MDKITSILSTAKRPIYTRTGFHSKKWSSNEQLFLPAISMMTLKHRDTNQRHHGNQRNYGNRYVEGIDSRNSEYSRKHGNKLLSNMKCETDEREIVVKYRLEKEKETEDINNILITKPKSTHLRTVSRQRAELASREIGERLIKRGVTVPTPPLVTKCPPKRGREGHSFDPSAVHQRYKSLSEESKAKCCESVEAEDGKSTSDGKQAKRYVHVYLCCCRE